MPTAEELLNETIGDEANSKVLTVDLDSRSIIIPATVKHLGVTSDDDVVRLDFSMPRYYDDLDLDAFTKQINYLNAKGKGDIYRINDAVSTDDTITFSWLVGRFAVEYTGNVRFNLCFKQYGDPNDNTIVTKEFNTTVATLPALEGLETNEAIVQTYPDLLVQWENSLFGIGDTEEAQIRNAGAEEKAAITALSELKQSEFNTNANIVLSEIDLRVHRTVMEYCENNNMQVPSDAYIESLISAYLTEYFKGNVTISGTLTANKVVGAVYE